MKSINIKDYLSQNKIFAHLDRVQEWIKEGVTKPIMMEIDPTNLCNSNCSGCAGNRFGKQVYLSKEFMKNLIDQVSPFLKGLVFTGGGEPLRNKDTLDVVKYSKKKGIDVGFITNGELLTKNAAELLVKNCSWVRVSVDAANEKDYFLVHGKEEQSYFKVLEGIKLLVEARKSLESKCTLGTGYLTNKNLAINMFYFAKKMKGLGVDYSQFRPFHFDTFDVSREIKHCRDLEDENFKIAVSQHRYDKVSYDYPIAFRDEFTTVVAADGKLYPDCFTRGRSGYELGDLNKNSFEEIWTSDRKREVFENKLKKRDCPVMCKYDILSNHLWNIKKTNEKRVHLSFI